LRGSRPSAAILRGEEYSQGENSISNKSQQLKEDESNFAFISFHKFFCIWTFQWVTREKIKKFGPSMNTPGLQTAETRPAQHASAHTALGDQVRYH
jgi:hypothetical protein